MEKDTYYLKQLLLFFSGRRQEREKFDQGCVENGSKSQVILFFLPCNSTRDT